MMKPIPPRLHAPLLMIVGGLAVIAVSVAVHGWIAVILLGPIVLASAAGYYLWGGRDGDVAAMIGHKTDERQANLRLKMQALVGRVMTAAAIVAYLVAVAVKAPIWPFTIFIVLPALTLFAGWLIYRERGDGRGSGSSAEPT